MRNVFTLYDYGVMVALAWILLMNIMFGPIGAGPIVMAMAAYPIWCFIFKKLFG